VKALLRPTPLSWLTASNQIEELKEQEELK
jgi:hypothetical protein